MIERNGGDDGARTRDLRRDRKNVFPSRRLYLLFFQLLGASLRGAFLLCYSRCFSWFYFNFAVDELYSLLAKLREEVLISFQRFAPMSGVLGNDVIGHAFA